MKTSSTDKKNVVNRLMVNFKAGKESFELKNYKEGKIQFDSCLNHYNELSEPTNSEYITVGDCLKKLGWYWRKQKAHDRAHAFHIKRLNLMQKHGTPVEVHDSFLSLDIDAYYLKDLKLSQSYLEQSIEVAKSIKDNTIRSRSLAMSENNLAGTLSDLKDFPNAVGASHEALDHWLEYEEVSSNLKEHRVVWAFYNLGNIYEKWANSLRREKKQFMPEKNQALRFYQLSLERGREHELLLDDLDKIELAISRVGGL
ncbi:hypothetical protein N9N67_07020 [Bacteriovoracaceae bacterium]|nr:hypothetical protein [Bacteriovoracaceae bacterium]